MIFLLKVSNFLYQDTCTKKIQNFDYENTSLQFRCKERQYWISHASFARKIKIM